MKSYKNKVLFIALVILLAVMSLAFMSEWECAPKGVCHALLHPDSSIFLLCASGEFNLLQHGLNSWEVVCINPSPQSFMPLVGR